MTALVLRGDARNLPLPDASVDLIVTSPPYFGLRSYTDAGEHYTGQIGSEATPAEFLEALWACTAEMVRVLKPSGSVFVNLGDKYQATSFDHERRRKDASGVQRPTVTGICERCGQPFEGGLGRRFCSSFCGGSDNSPRQSRGVIPNKSLLGLPWRYAIGCTDRLGLILRAEIVWSKPNGLPESVTDRVRRSHEQVFHFTKRPRYYAAVDEIREPYSPKTFTTLNSGWGYAPDDTQHARAKQANWNAANGITRKDALNPLGKLPGSVWEIPSAPLVVPEHLGVDHFAAFPPALVRPIVLGWSPPGVCVECGEGRRPVVDKRYLSDLEPGQHAPVPNVFKGDKSNPRDRNELGQFVPRGPDWVAPGMTAGKGGSVKRFGDGIQATITGYACACPQPTAPTRPAVVLDPFGGTGTTALVAAAHGRVGIGVDLSHDYSRLARWRTTDRGEIARALGVRKPPPEPEGMDTLFTLP